MENPRDLPISVHDCEIMNPSKLAYTLLNDAKYICENNRILIDKNKCRNEMKYKNVVICGSMVFYDKMLEISNLLEGKGIPTVIPKEETMEREVLTEKEFSDFKRRVSNQYLAKIRDSSTYAILVLNQEKKGISNYIGANTLVEISMAFCWGREIYLLNDLYEPLKDELEAWNALALNGNIDILIENYKNERYILVEKDSLTSDGSQIELGDIDEYFYPLFR